MKKLVKVNFYGRKKIVFALIFCFMPLWMTMVEGKALAREAQYRIYVGGIPAMNAHIDWDNAQEKYKLAIAAETYGPLSGLFTWKGTLGSEGRINKGVFFPRHFISETVMDGQQRSVSLLYDEAGGFKEKITTPKAEQEGEIVPEALTNGTVDVLTALANAFARVEETGYCTGQWAVFDGRRRFWLKARHEGKTLLKPSTYNVFSGEASLCDITIIPQEGVWKKRQKQWLKEAQGADNSKPLARFYLGKHHGKLVLARFETPSPLGMVMVNLIDDEKK
ncbi:MAG: DUF3108 domain-containing protein [Alphaproteobacteria bacterium]